MKSTQTKQTTRYQSGAVSLFVVIFTALLFVTVTVGFTVLMMSNQQQATNNDLAQSALDSAEAGTEDAKRVLAKLADCQERKLTSSGPCMTIANAVRSAQCNTVKVALGMSNPDNPERMVQSSASNDTKLDQAYTCVKISPDTDSYIGKTKDESEIRVIPLRGAGAFAKVRVSWLMRDDMGLTGSEQPNFDVPYYNNPRTVRLLTKDQWINGIDAADRNNGKRGAVLRVQTIQYMPGSVDLSVVDDNQRTAFLYPANVAQYPAAPGRPENTLDLQTIDYHKPISELNRDARPGMETDLATNKPQLIKCADSVSGYMCTADLILPNTSPDAFSYLTLASVYRSTSFKVQLFDASGNVVKFKNVQPEIDATGRANDVFRRVVSRVETADANQAPYPRAEVGTENSMCKDYVITDDEFVDNTTSIPNCPNITALTPTH